MASTQAAKASARVGEAAGNTSAEQGSLGNTQASSSAKAAVPPSTVVLCTAGYDHTIRFWEAWSGICSRTIQHPDSQVNRLIISPDKKYLAAAGNTVVRLFDITHPDNNTPVHTFQGHTANITALAFHIESKWIATASEDETVKIWDMRTCTVQRNFKVGSPVKDIVIHPNWGEIISCDKSGSIKVWDLGEASLICELVPAKDVPIQSIAIASDGSCLVAANNMGKCFVWKMFTQNDKTAFTAIFTFTAHETYITRVVLSPDVKHLATCSADETVKIWSTHNFAFKLEKQLKGHTRWVWDATFSADSAYLITASTDHEAKLWELSTGATVKQYTGHHKGILAVALNDTNVG